MTLLRKALLVLAIGGALALATLSPASAEEGWVVQSFQSDITVTSEGRMDVVETIVVDFGTSEHHGIIRELVTRERCGAVTTAPHPSMSARVAATAFIPSSLRALPTSRVHRSM